MTKSTGDILDYSPMRIQNMLLLKIKYPLLVLFSLMFINCFGVAVGYMGTFEESTTVFELTDEKNNMFFNITEKSYTNEDLVKLWGEPDKKTSEGKCEVFTYRDGYNWNGIGAFIIIIPVPLLIPTGRNEARIYLKNGKSVGAVKEFTEAKYGLGYMCGSNECEFLAGRVNKELQEKANYDWCK